MVVVRESPRAKQSPDKNNAQWPPKSPFQALLSSPSGRKKWQDHRSRAEDRSPSPSPMRKQTSSSQSLQRLMGSLSGDEEEKEEEEDEEMLQLKLQQIETRLKLKRLQKAKKEASVDEEQMAQPKKSLARPATLRSDNAFRPDVEVPLSPVRVERPLVEQVSPARRRLGLDAPFRAQEVSLKRARPTTGANSAVRRTELPANAPRPKSFSERLAESRDREDQREARKDLLGQIRSSSFGQRRTQTPVGSTNLRPSSVAESLHERPPQNLSRSASARTAPSKENSLRRQGPPSNSEAADDEGGSNSDAGYDPFSQTHLSKRHITHALVAREMEGKQIYPLTRLLKEVKSPEYEPPDCESDYVVFAILASKSSPYDHASTQNAADKPANDNLEAPKNKFMVLHLCDLKYEVDLFLFGTAFNQFWKLTPGTLLAILNPAIMPPKSNQHSGKFSLKLSSSSDAVMEIGVARDLGYCVSVKKDGQQCADWIDKRKTEVCEFHMNLQIDKSRKHRMEVNTMFRSEGNVADRKKSRTVGEGEWKKRGGSGRHTREYGTLYSVNTGLGRSAETLLDDDDTDALHNMTREEASRKRLAAAQKDRDLARRLGESGRGMGAEYLRASTSSSGVTRANYMTQADEARAQLFAKPTAAELGLGANNAREAHLSPAKDRKRHFGLGEMSSATAKARDLPMGWGNAKKIGVSLPPRRTERLATPELETGQARLQMHAQRRQFQPTDLETASSTSGSDSISAARIGTVRPRSSQGGSSIRSGGSTSPVKKRARFALEKGIREPGRESLPDGFALGSGKGLGIHDDDDDDDDDELDIV